jgi:hypothetical protein
MNRTRLANRTRARRGNTILEFGLVAIFLVPLFLGTVNLGLNLSKTVQVSQIARDAGHMYVRQLDFSLDGSKDMVVRLASGLGMTRTGGNGVVILSKVLYVGPNECAAANLAPASCPNYHKAVFTQRHIIGNISLRTSNYGTPAPNIVLAADDSALQLKKGDIRPVDYLTHVTAATTNFTTLLPGMLEGEVAYVAEAYFDSPQWALQQSYTKTAKGVYARSIY